MSLFRISTVLPAAGLVLALTFGSSAARAAELAFDCNVGGVHDVTVGLMTAVSDPETRREEMHISRGLAQQLGISTSGPLRLTPGGEINPQIRVVIETPEIDGRQSSAVFTVTSIFEASTSRIRVYRSLNASDKDSGQFKLFKDAAPAEVDLTITDNLGDIADVSARVYWTPVATSTVTRRNSADPLAPSTTTPSKMFCEPAQNGSNGFFENAIIEANKSFALVVPHGGAIETKTSDQITSVLNALSAGWAVHGSLWEANGTWGLEQTRERWHITATAILAASYPALTKLFAELDFAAAEPAQPGQAARPARPFQYVLALHGFDAGATEKGLILGGQADREAKCLVALRIQDELETSRGSRNEIGFRIFDSEGAITVASSTGYIPPADHSGLANENIVNRLSPNPNGEPGWGGLQIEQSKAVRNDETNGQGTSGTSVRNAWLRHVVARGAAAAIGELITEPNPTNACAQLTGAL
ncbi:MAG TPA: hypothetical protein VKK31_31640 [Thermoanaerobaculia bacterium]|nr:hypothetical protein [Thermoanaerobaculia bacterium]